MFRILFSPNATFATVKALLLRSMLFGLSLPGCAAHADVYKWVAEDGVTHYSERKPGVPIPIETIVHERKAETEAIPANLSEPASVVNKPAPAPPPAPRVCDGKTGATVVGTLAMLLNRAYIASIPDFVADNADVFADEQFYVCLDAIFASALLHEQLTGGDSGTVSPDAPLAVLLETSADLADALRALNDGVSENWRAIQQKLQARRPRLEADMDSLTRLIRSVIVDAQSAARTTRLQAGTR